jgi:hypothetical protein
VMVLRYQSWRGSFSLFGVVIPYAGVWAMLLFMLAHVGYTISPFAVTSVSPTQQVQVAILGVV